MSGRLRRQGRGDVDGRRSPLAPRLVVAACSVAALVLVACGNSSQANTTPGSNAPSPARTPSSAPVASPTPFVFHALDGQQLPGTAASDWGQLQEQGKAPSPAADMEQTSSNDLAYAVAYFDFSSPTDAAAFYRTPPGEIQGFLAGALGYTDLNADTGAQAPARSLDLRTCSGEGTGPTLAAGGKCSDGSGSYTLGVSIIVQRGSIVMFVGYQTGSLDQSGNPADVSKVRPYVKDALSLLTKLGFRAS